MFINDGVFNNHVKDIQKHIPFVTASNSGNTYSIQIDDLDYLEDGQAIMVKFNAASTGAISVSVNGGTAKSVVDYFGNAVTNIRAGLIANLAYSADDSNFQLQGKGGDGDALITDIRQGKKATTREGLITGVLPVQATAAQEVVPGTSDIVKPAGIYDGPITVKAGYAIGTNIAKDKLKEDYLLSEELNIGGSKVAIDSNGNIYAIHTDNSGKTVQKFDSNGNEIWSDSAIAQANSIALDSNGNVYVTYGVNSGKTVRKFDSNGNELWSDSSYPYASYIIIDSNNNIYVGYKFVSSKSLRKLNSSGTEIWSKPQSSGDVLSMYVDAQQNIYVGYNSPANNISLIKYNSSGTIIWSKTGDEKVKGIITDENGAVYVICSRSSTSETVPSVRKYNSEGTIIWFKSEIQDPSDIAIDHDGNIYIAYSAIGGGSGKCMQKLNSNGDELWNYLDTYKSTVIVDSNNNFYLCNTTNVKKFTPNGYKIIA